MKSLTIKSSLNLPAVLMAILLTSVWAEAAPHDVIDSPQHIGGFTHNVFHTSRDGGPSGSILAWMDLDTTQMNTYDPVTGDLVASFNLFNDSNFAQPIGSVLASGNLPGNNFQGDGGLAGTITWTFDFDVDNILEDYLEGLTAITMNYLDQVYVTSSLGTDVNSWDDPYLSLWGSGRLALNDMCGDQQECPVDSKYLGSDVVIETAHTPEPMTAALLGTGMIGAFGLRRQRRRR
ncbi:MAG: PEP-CTERM sorting domain-containing protein [Candidatus Omnitrophica bacterium]|nr:PEP-CTERM sorting domain-containing protein [Candidatus Omnitrophota bacterium]